MTPSARISAAFRPSCAWCSAFRTNSALIAFALAIYYPEQDTVHKHKESHTKDVGAYAPRWYGGDTQGNHPLGDGIDLARQSGRNTDQYTEIK